MVPAIGLLILGVLAFLILRGEKLLSSGNAAIYSVLLLLTAMALRWVCMAYDTLDYQTFLTVWVDTYRRHGGFAALSHTIGNYNIPYNYFLALFSYLKIRDLYLIKWLTVLFDILLAWGVMRLVGLFRENAVVRLGAFFLTLLLPTVLLNGALWGQCDAIYVAFAVWALYFALDDKPIRSVVFIALSFAFKMQAVFLMPLWLILIFARKVKWWHLAAFPVAYFVVMLPAILLGRPLRDVLYVWQAGSIGDGLNYNSPSVFALIRVNDATDTARLSVIGIAAAFGFLVLLFVLCWIARRRLDRTALMLCAALISVAVPFLLPHMHDRYFFLFDILSVCAAFVMPKLLPLPFLASFASLLGYHAYLKRRYLLPMRYGAYALLLSITVLIVCLVWRLGRSEKASSRD